MAFDAAQLKEKFKEQIESVLAEFPDESSRCACGSGMLTMVSALQRKDGPSLPVQIAVMYAALVEVGDARGWSRQKRDGG